MGICRGIFCTWWIHLRVPKDRKFLYTSPVITAEPQETLEVFQGLGLGHVLRASFLSRSVATPSQETVCPTYFSFSWQNWHLSRDNFNPCFSYSRILLTSIFHALPKCDWTLSSHADIPGFPEGSCSQPSTPLLSGTWLRSQIFPDAFSEIHRIQMDRWQLSFPYELVPRVSDSIIFSDPKQILLGSLRYHSILG